MNDHDFQERKTFLSQVEQCLSHEDYRTALDMARSRLKRAPGDMDARIVLCRVWIQQGRVENVRDMLSEMEEMLTDLAQVYACMGNICQKKGLQESADFFYRKFKLLNPASHGSGDEALRLMEIASQQDILAAEEAGNEALKAPADFQAAPPEEADKRQIPESLMHMNTQSLTQESLQEADVAQSADAAEMPIPETTESRSAPVISELSRWLGNIGKLRDRGNPVSSILTHPR